ncbi:hypothetical protein D3C87_1916060 [compost metagenome]
MLLPFASVATLLSLKSTVISTSVALVLISISWPIVISCPLPDGAIVLWDV